MGLEEIAKEKFFMVLYQRVVFLGNLVSLLIGVSLVGKRVLGEALFRFIAVSRHLRIRVEMVSNQYQEMDFIGTYRLSPVRAVSKGTFAECCES